VPIGALAQTVEASTKDLRKSYLSSIYTNPPIGLTSHLDQAVPMDRVSFVASSISRESFLCCDLSQNRK